MAGEYTFESKLVEDFYNKCHGPDGRFCSGGAKGKSRAGIRSTKGHGSGKTEPSALKLTQKYGTRGAGAGTSRTNKAGAPKKTASNIKYKADKYGSGKTNPVAKELTSRFGTRGARPKVKAKSSSSGSKYKADKYGSGKTNPEAKKLTEKYGTRRG